MYWWTIPLQSQGSSFRNAHAKVHVHICTNSSETHKYPNAYAQDLACTWTDTNNICWPILEPVKHYLWIHYSMDVAIFHLPLYFMNQFSDNQSTLTSFFLNCLTNTRTVDRFNSSFIITCFGYIKCKSSFYFSKHYSEERSIMDTFRKSGSDTLAVLYHSFQYCLMVMALYWFESPKHAMRDDDHVNH